MTQGKNYERSKTDRLVSLAFTTCLTHKSPMPSPSYTQDLIDKIRTLPDDKIAEVADFVEFLRLKTDEQRFARATTALSEPAFAKVWDNDADAEYDRL